MAAFLAKTVYNTEGWHQPSGAAKETGTHYAQYGFGYEEWLFRNSWAINGWQYGFIEGINFSAKISPQDPFQVTLFTRHPDSRIRYVAQIKGAERLTETDAKQAFDDFQSQGWLDLMQMEINRVQEIILAKTKQEPSRVILIGRDPNTVLNVRFRPEAVVPFDASEYVKSDDPIYDLLRYKIYEHSDKFNKGMRASRAHGGSVVLPNSITSIRKPVQEVAVTYPHRMIQAKLMEELAQEHPGKEIIREQEFADVMIESDYGLILYEIKCDLKARSAIRNALGQILEYAYHPKKSYSHLLIAKLIVVGRAQLEEDDCAYLRRLTDTFGLPLEYRRVAIGDE